MQKTMKAITLIFLSIWLTSCAKSSDTNKSGCGRAGLFASQADCQSNGSSGCSTTTVQSDGQNIVCWQSAPVTNVSVATPTPPRGTSSATNPNTTSNAGSVSGSGCTGPVHPWVPSAWVPANCKAGVNARSRTFSCPDLTCGCQGSQPAIEFEGCSPDLYLAKHYAADCEDARGSVKTKSGNRLCNFPLTKICPTGWTKKAVTNGIVTGVYCY